MRTIAWVFLHVAVLAFSWTLSSELWRWLERPWEPEVFVVRGQTARGGFGWASDSVPAFPSVDRYVYPTYMVDHISIMGGNDDVMMDSIDYRWDVIVFDTAGAIGIDSAQIVRLP